MRYWRLISIVAVVVVVISTFYIQSAVATKKYPEFELEKKTGDEKEAEGVTLYGDYMKGVQYHSLKMNTEGSKGDLENSYFERLLGENDPLYIKKLKQDYKSFMRGKDIDMDQSMFYEDKTLLAYVDLGLFDELDNEITFDIDMLEKKSKDRKSFQVTLQDETYNYVDLVNVWVRHGEVIVFTRNYVRESENTEIHAYWFNIADEKLTHEETILSIEEEDEQTNSDITQINSSDGKDNNNFILFQVEHYIEPDDEQMDIEFDDEQINPELKKTELMAYNLETNELEEIKLPEEIEKVIDTVLLQDNKLFFEQETKSSIEIFTYDIESKKIEDKYTMETSKAVSTPEDGGVTWNIDNNKLYMSRILKDDRSLADLVIVDLDSGDTLYEGTVQAKNEQSLPGIDEFIIRAISIE